MTTELDSRASGLMVRPIQAQDTLFATKLHELCGIMSIEFHCPKCNSLLRVPDETAGKKAKCPQCAAIVDIPSRSDPAGQPSEISDPAAPRAPPLPGTQEARVNPYQSPVGSAITSAPTEQAIKQKVLGPAIGMLVGASATLLYNIGSLVYVLVMGASGLQLEEMGEVDSDLIGVVFALVILVLGISYLICLLIIIGSISLMRLRSYAWSMAAAVLSLIPCSYCCVISLPFAIWAFIVLNDVHVRSAFSRQIT